MPAGKKKVVIFKRDQEAPVSVLKLRSQRPTTPGLRRGLGGAVGLGELLQDPRGGTEAGARARKDLQTSDEAASGFGGPSAARVT